jgi:hypothetical protein
MTEPHSVPSVHSDAGSHLTLPISWPCRIDLQGSTSLRYPAQINIDATVPITSLLNHLERWVVWGTLSSVSALYMPSVEVPMVGVWKIERDMGYGLWMTNLPVVISVTP